MTGGGCREQLHMMSGGGAAVTDLFRQDDTYRHKYSSEHLAVRIAALFN